MTFQEDFPTLVTRMMQNPRIQSIEYAISRKDVEMCCLDKQRVKIVMDELINYTFDKEINNTAIRQKILEKMKRLGLDK